jgi:hypothetical protein
MGKYSKYSKEQILLKIFQDIEFIKGKVQVKGTKGTRPG